MRHRIGRAPTEHERTEVPFPITHSAASDECVLFDVSGLRVHQRQEVPDRLLVVDHGGRPSVR